jgi:transposase-like protein
VTEQQLARMAKRRLAILRHAEEITGNVALTCRYYGISRQCCYTWLRRSKPKAPKDCDDGEPDRPHAHRETAPAARRVLGRDRGDAAQHPADADPGENVQQTQLRRRLAHRG